MKRSIQIVSIILFSLGMISCGTPGAPQPPSLDIPKQVSDLKAFRKGDHITLTWTQPTKTTDGMNIRHMGKTMLCRDENVCTEVKVNGANGVFTESVAETSKASKRDVVGYTLKVENARGRTGGPSNTATVLLTQIDFMLSNLKVEPQAEGVHISFNTSKLPSKPSSFTIELKTLRADKGTAIFTPINRTLNADHEPTAQGGSHWEMVDDTIEWEHSYDYKVVGIVTVLNKNGELGKFETDDSNTLEIFAHDIFPPAAPESVQAVANATGSERSVDITWSPNNERDLAGYNVYRREPEYSTKPEKINIEVLRGSAFKDTTAKAGHHYAYTITAVDVRNNESKPSQPADERVPQ
jgi:hypothetical protein